MCACLHICAYAYVCVCVCVCDITNYHYLFYKECANCLAIAFPAVNLEDCTDVFHHLMVNGLFECLFCKIKTAVISETGLTKITARKDSQSQNRCICSKMQAACVRSSTCANKGKHEQEQW